MPTFQLGFKCEPLPMGQAGARCEIVAGLAGELLFGESSELYLRMYEQGLIDTSFGGGLEILSDAAFLMISGDSEDPAAIRDAILEQAQILSREPIPEADFLRMKRSAMGRWLRGLDSFSSTCFRLCAYALTDYDFFDLPGVYEQIREDEVRAFLSRVVTSERSALSVILPMEQPEEQNDANANAGGKP
jgi:predicted Zn-dependent peptidase